MEMYFLTSISLKQLGGEKTLHIDGYSSSTVSNQKTSINLNAHQQENK